MPRGVAVEPKKTDSIYDIVKDGDIICRLGDRLWSQLFRNTSLIDRRFSHMGIVCINNGEITVIHAEGHSKSEIDYVNEIPLEDFIRIARSIGIYRIKDVEGNLIPNAAREFLGVPFDWQFDMDDESKIYCTELLFAILKRIKPEVTLKTNYLKEWKKEIIPLEAISNSDNFTEIYFADEIVSK